MSADLGRRAGLPVSLSTFSSTPRQRVVAGAVAAALTAVAFGALPYLKVELAEVPAFIAASGALIVVIDLITAYLLFRDASASRLASLAVLACGYLFTGLIAIAYTLVFPDNWTAPGIIRGSEPAAWMWALWHVAFAVAATAYAVLTIREGRSALRDRPLAIWPFTWSTTILVIGAASFSMFAGSYFPAMQNGRLYHALAPTVPVLLALFVLTAGLVGVFVRRGSVVPLWLAVGCCGFAYETALMLLAGERYTVGWYLGRVLALVASSTVLGSLLHESGRLMQIVSSGERRLRRVIDGVGDALLAVDDTGRIVDANPAACAVFGLGADELRGKDSAAVVAASPVTLEVGIGEGVLIARDVTEQRRAAAAAEEAIAQARESAAVKTRFLATMSHELRTPINAVVGLSELILETPLTDEARDYANTVRDSAEALVNVINDILDFSKIEAGATELERAPFSPLAAVEVVADILAPTARMKNVALVTFVAPDVPHEVLGDAHRLRQVLLNLVGNAVKFTEHGSVAVRATVERLVDERTALVQFAISDTGPGIAPELAARLFEPFRQADVATTRRYGGSGLGLSISKHLVELMGGEVTFDSALGIGTTFRFSIPLERVDGEPGERSALIGARVLLLDLEPNARAVTERYLGSWGAIATRAAPYDVAILSHGRGLDAFAELAELRAREATVVPAIFASESDEPGQAEAALQAGFAAHVRKPLRRSALYETLADVLTGTRPAARVLESDARPAPSRLAVLIVDDNAVNRNLTLQQLKKLGYAERTEMAENGREAIAAVAGRHFDLVLMDCEMPEVDGFTATRAIRTAEALTGEHVTIVAMTANAMEGDREACLQAGMDGYLAKPVQLADLRGAIERHAGAAPVR